MEGHPLTALPVRFIRHGVDAARIDPAIIEIEQRAHRDGEVDCVVIPTGFVERFHILGGDPLRVVIHLVHEAEQRFVFGVEPGALQVPQRSPNQFFATEQFRRDRSVGLNSKRALVGV